MDLPEKPTVKTERLYARGGLECGNPAALSDRRRSAKTAAAAAVVVDF
jgi:hypothetical protein